MAITWEVQITNVDVDQKRADVSFTRVDDVSGTAENYNYSQAIIETTEQRAALLQTVWDSHLAAVSKQTAIDAFITNLEQTAKSNLEAREV